MTNKLKSIGFFHIFKVLRLVRENNKSPSIKSSISSTVSSSSTTSTSYSKLYQSFDLFSDQELIEQKKTTKKLWFAYAATVLLAFFAMLLFSSL